MNSACPRCGAVRDTSSRFCTNCGSDLSAQAPGQAQVPNWATANPGGLPQQQQMWGGQGGSLGLGTTPSQQAFIKKALTVVVAAIAIALAALLVLGILAALIPGLRCMFFIAIAIVLLIPWLIYVNIRRAIRRTIGRVDRLWWLWLS